MSRIRCRTRLPIGAETLWGTTMDDLQPKQMSKRSYSLSTKLWAEIWAYNYLIDLYPCPTPRAHHLDFEADKI